MKLNLIKKLRSLLLCLTLLFGRGPASAAELADLSKLSIEDLMEIKIESVSKFEQRVVDAPASVSIITSDDIKKYGYRNLPDILRSVRGLFVNYDRNYSYLGVRGFSRPGDYNTRILLLVDGHRLNDSIYDFPGIGGDFMLDVDLVDRVEVIRGSGSSLYGTNALYGIINIKTKGASDIDGVESAVAGGRFSSFNGRMTYGKKLENGLEVLLSASRQASDGSRHLFYKEFNDPATNNGVAKNLDDERANSYFGKLSYRDFSLNGGYIDRAKDTPTASFGTLFNQDSATVDRRGYLDGRYEHNFANGLGLKTRLYYDWYNYRGYYLYDYAAPGDPPLLVTNKDNSETQRVGGEWQLTKTLFGAHKVILGSEYRYTFQANQRNYDLVTYSRDSSPSQDWAFYLQDEFEVVKGLRLNAGLRYDHYNSFGGTINPRIALLYQPVDSSIFKIIYGQAFRAPNAFELSGNSDLKPETTRSVEFAYQQKLGASLWAGVNLYYQRSKDLLTQVLDPLSGFFIYQNDGNVAGRGAELELEGRWQNGMRGRLSYALQQTKDIDSDKVVVNSPTHLVKLNGVLPLFAEKLFLGWEQQFSSGRKTLGSGEARPFFVTNVTLFSQSLFKNLETSASVYNLFDRKYSDPGAGQHSQDKLQQDGRGFRFKLTYRF